jgi:CheY-like chemotaxis protein
MKLCDARILFVDDEPSLLEIFSLWLAGESPHRIDTAADGQAALDLLALHEYDLLITDVNMPRINGIMLVRRLAEVSKTIPSIMFVSGYGDVDQREMYGLGVEAFLAKPITRETLLGFVERALTDRSELWRTPFEMAPRHALEIEAVDFSDSTAQGCLALGQGGFSAPYAAPVALGKVSFACHLSARDERFSGEGYVRWRSKDEGTIGVEFAYLEPQSRLTILTELAKKDCRAFIPAI